jgi:hypothetical protein
MRSTGLGNMELEAAISEVKRVDDALIFYVGTTKPVRWRVRMAFEQKDVRSLVWAILKPKNVWYVLRSYLNQSKEVQRSDSF